MGGLPLESQINCVDPPPPPNKKKEKREKKKREREREDKEQDGKKLTEFVAFFLMNRSILYAFMLFCILVG